MIIFFFWGGGGEGTGDLQWYKHYINTNICIISYKNEMITKEKEVQVVVLINCDLFNKISNNLEKKRDNFCIHSFHLFISPQFKNAHSAQLILKGAVNTNI